jgi:hypothetical protein
MKDDETPLPPHGWPPTRRRAAANTTPLLPSDATTSRLPPPDVLERLKRLRADLVARREPEPLDPQQDRTEP